jgi:hypothetical protein
MIKNYNSRPSRTPLRVNVAGGDRYAVSGFDWPGKAGKTSALTALLNTVRMSALIAAMLLATTTVSVQAGNLSPKFNKPGNILIADQFNNRVIEIDTNGNIVWQFGLGPNDFSPKSIIGVNDAQRVGSLTLMAGTSTPSGVVTNTPNGTADNRVILVDPFGNIVWQYGRFGKTGSGHDLLNTPVQCTWLPNTDVLITDQANNRIIEVNLQKKIVWSYPGFNTDTNDALNGPNSAELLENGHVLISDQGNNRALEVTHDDNDQIVATFSATNSVSIVAFSSRLPNGDTLLTDSGNARVVEVDSHDIPVWIYQIDTNPPSVQFPLPTRAVRLANGDTLISDQFNNRVIRVDSKTNLVMSYGLPLGGGGTIPPGPVGVNIGYDTHTVTNGLYAPYDAKVVGDYTGLTPPFDSDGDADDR